MAYFRHAGYYNRYLWKCTATDPSELPASSINSLRCHPVALDSIYFTVDIYLDRRYMCQLLRHTHVKVVYSVLLDSVSVKIRILLYDRI